MQNNSVSKSIFHFLGARIWTPMPVYCYENPSGYVREITNFIQHHIQQHVQ